MTCIVTTTRVGWKFAIREVRRVECLGVYKNLKERMTVKEKCEFDRKLEEEGATGITTFAPL